MDLFSFITGITIGGAFFTPATYYGFRTRIKRRWQTALVKHEHVWSNWEQFEKSVINDEDHWLVMLFRPRTQTMQKRNCFGCSIEQQEKVGNSAPVYRGDRGWI